MTRRLPFLALSFVLTAAAAPDPVDPPVPLRLIALPSSLAEQKIEPGAIVSRATLGRPDALILGAAVTLDRAGEKRAFARGDILRPVVASDVPGAHEQMFCEPVHRGSLGKALVGQSAFGLVGALRPTRLDTRFCLFDVDEDGTLDHAVLLGAKGSARASFAVPPVAYQKIEGRPLADDGLVRLRYAGPAGMTDRIAFDLEVVAFGRLRAVPHARSFVAITKLPAYGLIGSAVVTILAYDPESRVATIRMDHGLAPGHIVLPELNRAY